MNKDPMPQSSLKGVVEAPMKHVSEQTEARERRQRTTLICPDNDAEAHMILHLAERMGMSTLRSTQKHGAKLGQEPDLVERIAATGKGEVWIVEMPGPELEAQLRERKLNVNVIDHHTYGPLNRAVDAATGVHNQSSLEQFLVMAGITDEELVGWGYDPKTVRGVGIFDDRFAQGLRDAGYSVAEIAKVIDQITTFSQELNPNLAQVKEFAEKDWAAREEWQGYLLVRSTAPVDVRGAIGFLAIREGLDTVPIIVSACGGKKLYVHEITSEVLGRLQKQIPTENTFTFGGTRCWGYDARAGEPTVTLEQVLKALNEEAKTTP